MKSQFNSTKSTNTTKWPDSIIQPSSVSKKTMVLNQINLGNRTIALGDRPLDPINNTVSFRIIKNGDGIPSICIGAAILNIVKQNNFTNCLGFKRGTYGIDQAMTSNWGSMQESHEATEQNQDEQTNNTGIVNINLLRASNSQKETLSFWPSISPIKLSFSKKMKMCTKCKSIAHIEKYILLLVFQILIL